MIRKIMTKPSKQRAICSLRALLINRPELQQDDNFKSIYNFLLFDKSNIKYEKWLTKLLKNRKWVNCAYMAYFQMIDGIAYTTDSHTIRTCPLDLPNGYYTRNLTKYEGGTELVLPDMSSILGEVSDAECVDIEDTELLKIDDFSCIKLTLSNGWFTTIRTDYYKDVKGWAMYVLKQKGTGSYLGPIRFEKEDRTNIIMPVGAEE